MSAAAANVLRLDGRITMRTAEAWRARGREQLRGGDLEVDFAAVTEADSSALALLLDWMRVARNSGQVLRPRGVPEGLRSLAALYGIDDLLVEQA